MAYDDDDVALNHLMEARLLAPTHPATLIGLYRFYFYKGRLAEALAIAQTCLTRAAIDYSLPLDWRNVAASDAAFGDYDAVGPRFFMFSPERLRLSEHASRRSRRKRGGHRQASRT